MSPDGMRASQINQMIPLQSILPSLVPVVQWLTKCGPFEVLHAWVIPMIRSSFLVFFGLLQALIAGTPFFAGLEFAAQHLGQLLAWTKNVHFYIVIKRTFSGLTEGRSWGRDIENY